jgi:hypothetical protein
VASLLQTVVLVKTARRQHGPELSLMETSITNREYFEGEPLAEPHFDDEATLLSARPVVPLQEIRAEERSGKRLAVGAAMVFSLLVGAFGTALIYKQRAQKQATAIVNTVVPGVDGMAVEEPDTSNANVPDAASGTLQEPDSPTEDEARDSIAAKSSSVETSRRQQVSERELRRAERNESRRLKRESASEAHKESRGRRSKSSDDLLRVREIFEGSRRP